MSNLNETYFNTYCFPVSSTLHLTPEIDGFSVMRNKPHKSYLFVHEGLKVYHSVSFFACVDRMQQLRQFEIWKWARVCYVCIFKQVGLCKTQRVPSQKGPFDSWGDERSPIRRLNTSQIMRRPICLLCVRLIYRAISCKHVQRATEHWLLNLKQ